MYSVGQCLLNIAIENGYRLTSSLVWDFVPVCKTYEKSFNLQIFITTVPLLTDQDLIDLGVEKVGDRATLRKLCRDSLHSMCVVYVVMYVCMYNVTKLVVF